MSAFAGKLLRLGKYALKHPVASLATADVLGFIGSEAVPFARNVGYRASGRAFDDQIRGALHQDELQRSNRARLAMLMRARAENEARLAAMDPHLYSELIAGQRLPPGGVVMGGVEDRRLLDEVTMSMATGSFGDTSGAEVYGT